jgi:hypothetical protein
MHSWQKRGMSSQPVGKGGLLGVWGRYLFLTSLTEPRIFFLDEQRTCSHGEEQTVSARAGNTLLGCGARRSDSVSC